MSSLYQQALLAHHQSPVGYQLIIEADICQSGYNPACGDEIDVKVRLEGNRLSAIAFDGESCAICRASASMMCQQLTLQNAEFASQMIAQVEQGISKKLPFEGELAPLNAVFKYPIRGQCALLPWQTLRQCLADSSE